MPDYGQSNIHQGIRNAISGYDREALVERLAPPTKIPDAAKEAERKRKIWDQLNLIDNNTDFQLVQLQALHVWIRLQNQYNTTVDLSEGLKKNRLAALQAGLRLLGFIAIGNVTADATGRVLFDNNQLYLNKAVDAANILILENLTGTSHADAKACLTEIQTKSTVADYTEMLLSDINTYVQRHGLSAITEESEQQDNINEQLAMVNPPFDLLRDGVPNFILRGMILSLTFPVALPVAFFRGVYLSIKNAYNDKPDNSHYGTQVTELLNRKDEKGRSLRNTFAPVRFVLHFFEVIINAFTATFFEPLRYLLSYEGWQPENKRRFDAIEKGLFNIAFSPFILALGLFRAIGDTYKNLKDLSACDDELKNDKRDVDTLLETHGPYGLGMMRFFKWLDNSPNFTTGAKYFLMVVFAPLTLAWFLAVRIQKARDIEMTFPALSGRNRVILAIILSPILLPVDLFVGTLMNAARALGQKVSPAFEQGFHNFMSQIWATFLLTTIGPMAWGGALAAVWTPIIKPIAVWFKAMNSSLGLPVKEIFSGIYKYTGGAGAQNVFWGSAGHPGIIAQGWNGFAGGMKAFGNAIVNPNTWNFLGNISFAGFGAAMKLTATILTPIVIVGTIVRGWVNPKAALRSVFGHWGKPDAPAVAADKPSKYKEFKNLNQVKQDKIEDKNKDKDEEIEEIEEDIVEKKKDKKDKNKEEGPSSSATAKTFYTTKGQPLLSKEEQQQPRSRYTRNNNNKKSRWD